MTTFRLIVPAAVAALIAASSVSAATATSTGFGFKDRANNSAAQADIRAAIPAAEAFYSEQNPSTYVGMTAKALKKIDPGLSRNVVVSGAGRSRYCIGATVGGLSWSVNGPGLSAWHKSANCSGARVTP